MTREERRDMLYRIKYIATGIEIATHEREKPTINIDRAIIKDRAVLIRELTEKLLTEEVNL